MKKIILLIAVLFITGCSVKYDLTITDKEEIKEKMVIPVDNKYMLTKYKTTDEFIDAYLDIYNSNRIYNDYNITAKKSYKASKFIVKREYKDLDQYITGLTFKSMYNKAYIERTDGYVKFTTTKNAYLESIENGEIIDPNFYYDDFKVSIKFYNQVVDSNADVVDGKNNIYTWDLLSKDNYVMFKISDDKRYDIMFMNFINENLVPFIIFGGIAIVGIILLINIYIKGIKNNKI